jgi:polysaccharide export outer membrane protein
LLVLLLSALWCGLNRGEIQALNAPSDSDGLPRKHENRDDRHKLKGIRLTIPPAKQRLRYDPQVSRCEAIDPAAGQPAHWQVVQAAGSQSHAAPGPWAHGPGATGTAAYCPPFGPPLCAVDCGCYGRCGGGTWAAARPIYFQPFGHGEYVGHDRIAHVPLYRLRVDDQLECLYRLTREATAEPYQINVGDELQIESAIDEKLNRNLIVQPDGTVTLRLLGQVKATRTTVPEFRDKLESLYTKYYKVPAITVTPLKVNTRLEDLRATVDNRSGVVGGQGVRVRVTPEGTITLPAIGTVPAQGLTLDELKVEIDHRYAATISGIEVTPILAQRAPRYCYVLGEVRIPGRYTLEGPTTVMQAIALAGSWNVGANLKQVVIFRRADDWRLLATMVNLEGAMLYANQPCPAGEIWLNDSDLIILPKSKIVRCGDFIHLVFTRGVYGIVPFGASYNWGPTTIR